MSHKLKCPEDIRTCDDAINFGYDQEWGVRQGKEHVIVYNDKGSYAVPRGNHRNLSPGVRNAIIKMARYMLPAIIVLGVLALILERLA